jgi:hypothetical protein
LKPVIIVALAAMSAIAAAASARATTLNCEIVDPSGTSQMTLTYKGDASGKLSINGPFGAVEMPARKEKRQNGAAQMTGILANGEVKALMPDKTALDACVGGKLKPDERSDDDIIFVTRMGCWQQAPLATAPVPINLKVEIAYDGQEFVHVFFVRTYLEKSTIGNDPLTIESIPPPACKLISAN